LLAFTPAPGGDLRGFTAESAKAEREWETKFRAIPSPDSLRSYMRLLSARPHHVGSPFDKANAEWILAKFKSFGLDAQVETFDVLFPTPTERVVELVAPSKFVARLQEPAVAGDPTSSQQAEQLPTYNAYSVDGDVTAPLVYVNYGVPADYEQLDRLGISVKGAIVIARYFGSWRGIKPKVAAEHGAIGCIIYSDPRDDGLPRRPGPRARALEGQVGLEPEDVVRRDRAHPRIGGARRMGDPRQPPRCLGERRGGPDLGTGAAARGGARVRPALEAGLEAAPHHHLRRLGWRRADVAGLD
jgi:hypothetical protein